MAKSINKEADIKIKKQEVNKKHIDFYDKVSDALNFILDKYISELIISDIEFLDMPKNSVAVFDFLISSIIKVQKGQRLALGLDIDEFEDTSPQINIIEGIDKKKI